jgi:hypothetical protein
MKYYRHTMTLREQLRAEELQRKRLARAQAGFDFIFALFVCLSVYGISYAVLS